MPKDVHTYYWPALSEESLQEMSGDEAKHAIKVMRIQVGQGLRLIDGRGHVALASVESIHKKDLQFKLDSYRKTTLREPGFHLAIAPTKQIDRLEWSLEKCTEIGLARITPIICQNSERRQLRVDRLERIAIAAMKQSGAAYLPQVDEPILVNDFLESFEQRTALLIAHCRDEDKLELDKTLHDVCVMIGPEGDFTTEEVKSAISLGANAVHLGEKRLRTETAAVVACTLMNLQ